MQTACIVSRATAHYCVASAIMPCTFFYATINVFEVNILFKGKVYLLVKFPKTVYKDRLLERLRITQ